MILDFGKKGHAKLEMRYYIDNMLEEFPVKLKGQAKCPWNENLFNVNKYAKKLSPRPSKDLGTSEEQQLTSVCLRLLHQNPKMIKIFPKPFKDPSQTAKDLPKVSPKPPTILRKPFNPT